MVKHIENTAVRNKHGESWNIINKTTRRKTSKHGIINGNS